MDFKRLSGHGFESRILLFGAWSLGRAIRRPKGLFCCGGEAGLGLASTDALTPSEVAAIDGWVALVGGGLTGARWFLHHSILGQP